MIIKREHFEAIKRQAEDNHPQDVFEHARRLATYRTLLAEMKDGTITVTD